MDESKTEQPIPGMSLTPEEMEAQIERLKAEGRMPTFERFMQAVVAACTDTVQSSKEQGLLPPDYEPMDLLPAVYELLSGRVNINTSEPVSIGDYQQVRDELRGMIGPGGYRWAMTKLTGKPHVVPIRTAPPELPTCGEDKHDLTIRDEGTIVIFTPHTEARKKFLREMLYTEPWQWLGETLCVDHRTARGIIDGAENEGLTFGFLG